jgi:capsular exopolysaccharide synthesis family protein
MTDPAATVADSGTASHSQHAVYACARFLRVLRHRKHIVVACLLVTALLGAIYYAMAERVYQADASLWVVHHDPEKWNAASHQSGYRQNMLPTYERLFTSAVVLQRALGFLQEMPIQARLDLVAHPRDQWLEELRQRLRARSVRGTHLIELSYRSQAPETAETVVHAVVRSYTDFIDQNHQDLSHQIADILEKNYTRASSRLAEVNRMLLDKRQNLRDLGLGDTDVVHPLVQEVSQLHEQLVALQQKRFQLESSLATLQQALRQGGDVQQHLLALEPTVGREVFLGALGLSTQDAEVAAQLTRQLTEERIRLEALLPYYAENHPEVRRLQTSVAALQRELGGRQHLANSAEQGQYNRRLGEILVGMVREQLRQTIAHEGRLQSEYRRAEDAAVELTGNLTEVQLIEDEQRRLTDLAQTLQDRLDSLDFTQDQAAVRVTVVSDAVADQQPVSPRLTVVLAVCLSAGTLLGLAAVYVLDVLDDRFRSPEELKQQLGTQVLAIIRPLPDTAETGVAALHTYTAPASVESESFRTLRTTVAFHPAKTRCLAVSSAEPADGKTTVMANLGVACTQGGKRVLLIDADLRRPGLSRLFGIRHLGGLGDLLQANGDDIVAAAAGLVHSTGARGLDVLGCGVRPPDPTGALAGPRFTQLLAWAESTYDQVLIDTPPLLAASDAAVVGRSTDGLILVIQPEKNHRRLVHRAAEAIHAANLNFVGVVANRVADTADHGYYGAGGYGYGYGHEPEDEHQDARRTAESDVDVPPVEHPTGPVASESSRPATASAAVRPRRAA